MRFLYPFFGCKECRKTCAHGAYSHNFGAIIHAKIKVVMLAIVGKSGITKGHRMKELSAHDVANVFVKLADTDSGDVLTNLKIQKLVYYAQGFHLAIFSTPLFKDDIVAWEHGPVVVELYRQLKGTKKYGPVTIKEPVSNSITEDQLNLLAEINNVYGQFSAWKLRDMTHNEMPWLTTSKNKVISHLKMTRYFKTQLQ